MEHNENIFETHIHFSSEVFRVQFRAILNDEPYFYYMNVATNLKESQLGHEQSRSFRNMFCSIGVHPLYILDEENIDTVFKSLERILESDADTRKIRAIGECGLDFYKMNREESSTSQIAWFKRHILLSIKYKLPLILHLRDAYLIGLQVLNEFHESFGIIHSFDGTHLEALEILNSLPGTWMISISPLIFRDIGRFKKIIEVIPEDRILVESDSPYLSSSQSICRSILRVISDHKKIPILDLKKRIFANSLNIFKISSDEM